MPLQDYSIDEILAAIRNLERGGGLGYTVRNPLDWAATMYRRESLPFTYDPISGQMVVSPSLPPDTYEKYGMARGAGSFMYLRTPEGNVPVPITHGQLGNLLAAPKEVQDLIANMTPEQYGAFQQYIAGVQGEGGAGVREGYPAPPSGVPGSAVNPLGGEVAGFAKNWPYQPREISERERQRRQEARQAVERAANTPEATTVIKRMVLANMNPLAEGSVGWGGEAAGRDTAIKSIIDELAGRGAFGMLPPLYGGAGPRQAWTEYFGSPNMWGTQPDLTETQTGIRKEIAGDYNEMMRSRALDLVGRRQTMSYDQALRIAQKQLRQGYVGSVKGEKGGAGGFSTWG